MPHYVALSLMIDVDCKGNKNYIHVVENSKVIMVTYVVS